MSVTVRREYIDGRFGQMHVRRSVGGNESKRPLICLHLSPGSGLMYEKLLTELGQERHCFAPDTPGYGASDAPKTPPMIQDFADAVGQLIDHYELPSIDLLGYHTGSKIAIALAQSRPEIVNRLALVSAPSYTEEQEASQRVALAQPRGPLEDGSHLVAQWSGLIKWKPEGTPLSLIQREFGEQQRAGELAHWGYQAAFAYRHADHLPLVQQRVLLLCPQDDLEEPTLRSESLINNGEFRRLPGWGHQMMNTRTEEMADILRRHFDQDLKGNQ